MRNGNDDFEADIFVEKGIAVSKLVVQVGWSIGWEIVMNDSPICHTFNDVALNRTVESYAVTKENGYVMEERPRASRRSMDDVKRKSTQKMQNFQLYQIRKQEILTR